MASAHESDHNAMCIGEMMRRLGIEPGGGIVPRLGLAYAAAFRRCEQCLTPDACREWLKEAPQALNMAPKFCANADIFFELQFDQPGPGAFEPKKSPDQA